MRLALCLLLLTILHSPFHLANTTSSPDHADTSKNEPTDHQTVSSESKPDHHEIHFQFGPGATLKRFDHLVFKLGQNEPAKKVTVNLASRVWLDGLVENGIGMR